MGRSRDFGIRDITSRSAASDIYIPMRAIANGTGSEVIFTLFRLPDTTADAFARDAEWVERDVHALKAPLEG